ncbi:hypothetical protein GJ496_003720 [Pomphorhynchus laevis]|nr:hypothetical protein GJ496_003720 [Pomphorhynchus laevis]
MDPSFPSMQQQNFQHHPSDNIRMQNDLSEHHSNMPHQVINTNYSTNQSYSDMHPPPSDSAPLPNMQPTCMHSNSPHEMNMHSQVMLPTQYSHPLPNFHMNIPPPPFTMNNMIPPPPIVHAASPSTPTGPDMPRMMSNVADLWSGIPTRPSFRVDIRFLISRRDYDLIMTRVSGNIQKLCSDKAVVQITENNGPELIVNTFGEMDACARVIDSIFPALIESNQFPLHACDLRLLIHQSHAGAIIGRKGDRVKELRSLYQVDIKVFPECCPKSSERVVRLRGRPDCIVACCKDVYAALLSITPKGQLILYESCNYNEEAKEQYGGYSFAELGPNFASSSNTIMMFTNEIYSSDIVKSNEPIDESGSTTANKDNTQSDTDEDVNNFEETKAIEDSDIKQPPDSEKDKSELATISAETDDQIIISRCTVPPQLVPVLFGPAGTKLDDIKRSSCCNIIIGGSVAKTGDTIITIRGTKRHIQSAQFLMQTAVRQSGLWND